MTGPGDSEETRDPVAENGIPSDVEDSPSSDAAAYVDEATVDDLDRVLECWLALIEHGRQYGLHIEPSPNRMVARETLAAAIADDLAFVARVDERVVGFCSLTVESGGFERDVDRGVIENIYVEPAARGEGLGAALLAAGERRLVERGADVVAVETMVADEAVQSFYADREYHPHRVTLEKRVETDR